MSGTSVPVGPSLSSTVGTGMVFMAALSIATKVMSLLTQVVLAARLTKVEWAIGGLAVSIAAFPAVLQNAGLSSVLVHRQRGFGLWSRGAASLGLALGLIAWVSIVGAGVVAAPLYHSPELVGLMVFVGTAVLVNSAAVVPSARLQIDLRYGTVAKIGLLTSLTLNCLSAAMAFYGLGPYACVVPQVVSGLVNVSLLWRHSGVPVQFRINLRVWRFLLADAATIIVTNLMWAVGSYGDNIAVSLFASKESLATYFFAYTVSFQIVQMMAGNAYPVLLPALTKLSHDPTRQARAFLRGVRVMASVCYPLIGALALLCPQLLQLMRPVWGHKWDDTVPIIRILCVGMCLFLVSMSTGSLFAAQGRFKATMYFSIYAAMQFIGLLSLGAYLGGVIGVAVAVAVHHWIYGSALMWLGVSRGGLGLRDIAGTYWAAGLACLGAILAGYAAKRLLLPVDANPSAIVAASGVAGAITYVALLRVLSPEAALDARVQLLAVWGRLAGRFGRARRPGP